MAAIITFIQDPRCVVVLTRYGKDVGAIVSRAELDRIKEAQDIDKIAGGFRPTMFTFGQNGAWKTGAEAAHGIRKMQVDRLVEREVLKKAGMEPVPGGELMAEDMAVVEVREEPVARRRWWRFW